VEEIQMSNREPVAHAIELARDLAAKLEEDVSGWSDDDFVLLLLNEGEWRAVLKATWSGGSFARIDMLDGLFVGRDDAETYGPYATFEEAKSKLHLSSAWDRMDSLWTDPDFAD
jgi:hypothetical protein